MESTTDLTLKGHFQNLKEQANGQRLGHSDKDLILRTRIYLEKMEQAKALDAEGLHLLAELRLATLSHEDLSMPARKPMVRAGNVDKSVSAQGKKTG